MEPSLAGPPDSVVKALLKPNARNVAKAVGNLLNWANANRDHVLEQKSHHLLTTVTRTIERALPDTDRELIGGFCADLLDLWETGQKLDKELRKLKKLRFPRDRESLGDVLSWIAAIQIDMASYWIGEVKKDLPKLRRALDKLERKPRSGNQKRKLVNARSAGKRKGRRGNAVTDGCGTIL
jgi:hypothetical protein